MSFVSRVTLLNWETYSRMFHVLCKLEPSTTKVNQSPEVMWNIMADLFNYYRASTNAINLLDGGRSLAEANCLWGLILVCTSSIV